METCLLPVEWSRPARHLGCILFLASLLAGSSPANGASLERGLDQLDFRAVVKEAKARVFPTVVFIKCLREAMERGEKQTQAVSGSGVLISAGGEVLSNWHVVDRAQEVRCLLQDGRAFNARVVGADKDTDVALLQLELPPDARPLPFATLGESGRLTEGDFVMAMGAPFGLARSVSIGIVSCTNRYLPQASEYSTWLQTDASISPGNSGGPLVNTDGEVIGINTRGTTAGGDTGFAVPIEVAREVADRIRLEGAMNWSWTGLQLQPLRDFDRNVYFPETEGVVVAGTDPESPARRAGIQTGDRIIRLEDARFDGLTQEDIPGLRRRLGLLAKDQPATIELVRQGQPARLELTPRAKGRVEGELLDCPRWDFTLKAINQFDTPELHFQRAEGVFVFGIKYPGNAARAGLNVRDILLQIDGRDVKTLDEVRVLHAEALENVATRRRVLLTVLRNGVMRQIVLDFSRVSDQQ